MTGQDYRADGRTVVLDRSGDLVATCRTEGLAAELARRLTAWGRALDAGNEPEARRLNRSVNGVEGVRWARSAVEAF